MGKRTVKKALHHPLLLTLLGLTLPLPWVRGAEPPPAPRAAAAEPPGVIATGVPEFQLELIGPDGPMKVAGKEGRATVPRGRYIVRRATVPRRDRQGRVWEATFSPDLHPWLEVGVEPLRLDMSARLTAITSAEMHGSTAVIVVRFDGGAGALQYLTVNGERPPAPTLRIVDGKGRTVERLPSKYG